MAHNYDGKPGLVKGFVQNYTDSGFDKPAKYVTG
jgi:hypothetical protein